MPTKWRVKRCGCHSGNGVEVAGVEEKKGLRCQICTGCGLCPGIIAEGRQSGIHILTKEGGIDHCGDLELFKIQKEEGIRLIAADIGTTTLAMELCDDEGGAKDTYVTVNPQVRFGSDVLSRIAAASDPLKAEELRQLIKGALTQGVKRFLKCMKKGESPLLVIAANTTMSYLLMGWDPAELGAAPFFAKHLKGAMFYLTCETDAENTAWIPCILLPGISAFVGGDILAGIQCTGMALQEKITLLVDLGTNGELAIGNQDRILTTATAAGPAFEGGANRGIWGADMVRFVAALLEKAILDDTGLLAEPYFTKGIRIGNVLVTKEGVRSLQLAKAAMAAGIHILCREYGITAKEIDRVVLAGGFGYYLRPSDAVSIGMLPQELLGKTVSGGNTALLGAKKIGASLIRNYGKKYAFATGGKKDFLKSGDAFFPEGFSWENVLKMPGRIENINLAGHRDFSEEYVRAMEFRALP